jgi:hypothetical protein
MTCAEFNDAVVDVARGVGFSDDAARHVATCEACAAALEEQREVARELNLLALEFRTARPSAFVEQTLVAAFRENAAAVRAATAAGEQGPDYWLRAAAAILVVFGLGAWLLLSSGAPSGGQIATGRTDHVSARPASSEFVPVLGYGPVTPEDSGVVVRVLLPEDAFQYFAVPVARIPGGQRFPADVLIADDGSVRAIRLVSDTGGRR